MPRIAGVDIPEKKRIEAALTYIYGVGRNNVHQLLSEAGVDPDQRAKNLTGEEREGIRSLPSSISPSDGRKPTGSL